MLKETANEISVKISDALGALDMYTMPIAAVILENYAEAIKKTEAFSEEAYNMLRLVLDSEAHILKDTEKNKMMVEVLKKQALGEGKEIFRGKL